MPFILPRQILPKLPVSRFLPVEHTSRDSPYFILQKRRKAFRADDRHLYRIVTREKTDGFRTKIFVGDDINSILNDEWKYICEELPKLIPKNISKQQGNVWLIAHFTQKALADHSNVNVSHIDEDEVRHAPGTGLLQNLTGAIASVFQDEDESDEDRVVRRGSDDDVLSARGAAAKKTSNEVTIGAQDGPYEPSSPWNAGYTHSASADEMYLRHDDRGYSDDPMYADETGRRPRSRSTHEYDRRATPRHDILDSDEEFAQWPENRRLHPPGGPRGAAQAGEFEYVDAEDRRDHVASDVDTGIEITSPEAAGHGRSDSLSDGPSDKVTDRDSAGQTGSVVELGEAQAGDAKADAAGVDADAGDAGIADASKSPPKEDKDTHARKHSIPSGKGVSPATSTSKQLALSPSLQQRSLTHIEQRSAAKVTRRRYAGRLPGRMLAQDTEREREREWERSGFRAESRGYRRPPRAYYPATGHTFQLGADGRLYSALDGAPLLPPSPASAAAAAPALAPAADVAPPVPPLFFQLDALFFRYGWKAELIFLLLVNVMVVTHEWKLLLFWVNAIGLGAVVYRQVYFKTIRQREEETRRAAAAAAAAAATAAASAAASAKAPQSDLRRQQPLQLSPTRMTVQTSSKARGQAPTHGVSSTIPEAKRASSDEKTDSPAANSAAGDGGDVSPYGETSDATGPGIPIGKTLRVLGASGTPVRNTAQEVAGSTFKVRVGPNYAANKRKDFSQSSMYHVIGADYFRTTRKVRHIARFMQLPRCDLQMQEKLGIPELLIVNFMVPDYAPSNPIWGASKGDGPGGSLVLYFRLTEETKREILSSETPSAGVKLLKNFIHYPVSGPNDYSGLRGRFKGICRVTNLEDPILNLNNMTKKVVSNYNGTPFLIRTSFSAYLENSYFEIDSDVHGYSYIALVALNGLKESIPELAFDLSLVIQGEDDTELPERILSGVHIFKPNMKDAAQFPMHLYPDEPT